jgi:alpha 1,2-mannosyltransferase
MAEERRKYGFVINFGELPETIPTLWKTTQEFIETRPELIKSDNCFDYFETLDGDYNYCHFWSNFEIASFSLFRSPAYKAYFDFLDRQGGFFYERWGDAPIHSLAVGMFLHKDEVIYFEDIGYKHEPFGHCPIDSNWRRDQNCICNPFHESDQTHSECQRRWNRFPAL